MEPNTPDTSNFLNWVEIKNFKSIKDLRLDCKRVNVFIGKPNVGKSNILEALGMLGAQTNNGKFFAGSIRYEQIKHLFYDNDVNEITRITSEKILCTLQKTQREDLGSSQFIYTKIKELDFINPEKNNIIHEISLARVIDLDGTIVAENENPTNVHHTKKYDFSSLSEFTSDYKDFLLPPSGPNLYYIIRYSKLLWKEFAKLFMSQGLEFVLSDERQEFILQKKDGPFVQQFSFFTIADTFRRFMFYIAAIESNKNSVLIFEEPEVHSFPPYTQDVAYRMVYSTDNQFFVSTHSPYLLQTLVENLGDDQLSVFVTYYENYETKAKALTPEELSFVQEYSTDVFFNLDRFIPTPNAASIS